MSVTVKVAVQISRICTAAGLPQVGFSAVQNGGYSRVSADQRLLQTVTRNLVRYRADRRIGMPTEEVGICEPTLTEH